jgi:predicted nucleic-acid-binding Zn-ribbon protein
VSAKQTECGWSSEAFIQQIMRMGQHDSNILDIQLVTYTYTQRTLCIDSCIYMDLCYNDM